VSLKGKIAVVTGAAWGHDNPEQIASDLIVYVWSCCDYWLFEIKDKSMLQRQ
jgi:hypothetical protein